jgi:hypothetical protein
MEWLAVGFVALCFLIYLVFWVLSVRRLKAGERLANRAFENLRQAQIQILMGKLLEDEQRKVNGE